MVDRQVAGQIDCKIQIGRLIGTVDRYKYVDPKINIQYMQINVWMGIWIERWMDGWIDKSVIGQLN